MSFQGSDFYKSSEFNYLKEMDWIKPGTVDNTKWVLSDEGLAHFERLVESLPAKDQVLIRMKVAGNAEKSEAEVKAYMQ